MGLSRTEIVENKVGDWKRAFDLIAPELTPDALREQVTAYINAPLPEGLDEVAVFTSRMNATLGLARLVAANDRAAATIAGLLVQGGIKPSSFDYGDDT